MEKRRNERDLEELKQIIRGIIESNGNRIEIRRLVKEFKETNGCDLPFNQFGFESVLELLQEMDDSFGIERQDKHKTPFDYLVFCFVNKDTKHLMDLIENQKQDDNQTQETLHPKSRFFRSKTVDNQRLRTFKPFSLDIKENDENVSEINSDFNDLGFESHWRKRPQRPAVCPLPDTRVIPIDERNKISDLMAKYETMNLSNFPVIYRIFHNKPLEFQRIGYSTLDQYLRDLPDLVRLETTKDGTQVIANQTKNKQNSQNNTINDFKQNDINVNLSTSITPNHSSHSSNNEVKHLNISFNGIHTYIPTKELENFRQILRSHSKGIPANKFSQIYFMKFKRPLVVDHWGYASILEMFAHLTDVFHLKRPQNGLKEMDEWILVETIPELKAQKIINPKMKKFDKQFKERVIHIIRIILETNPKKCFFIEDFPNAYELAFNERIDSKTYGYHNFKQLFIDLSKELDIDVKEKDKNKPFLIYRKKF